MGIYANDILFQESSTRTEAEQDLHHTRARKTMIGNQEWTMKGNKKIKLKDMETSHILNVIRMLEKYATNENDNIEAILIFNEELGYRGETS